MIVKIAAKQIAMFLIIVLLRRDNKRPITLIHNALWTVISK